MPFGRDAHLDVFEIGDVAQFNVLLFGGSGIDDEEYEARSRSLIPVFDGLLDELEQARLAFRFIHATAPYDVPFARFNEFPAARDVWTAT